MTTATVTTPAVSRPDYVFPPFVATEEQRKGRAMAKPKYPERKHLLSQDQLDFFWANGYLSLPGLFTAEEVKEMSDAADEIYNSKLVNPNNIRYDFATSEKAKERVLWKIDPFHDLHPVFRRTVFDRRILDALVSIYSGREPRLFKDKLIYKPPHSHGNGLHQDYNWWQGYPTSLLSVSVSIDPGTEENGCTVVYPRDPRLGFVGEPGTLSNEHALAADPSVTPENAVKNIAQPGDVLIFHAFTPHEAGPNKTDNFRRQMFLSYNDSGDGEFYFSHNEHYRQYYLAARQNPEHYFFF